MGDRECNSITQVIPLATKDSKGTFYGQSLDPATIEVPARAFRVSPKSYEYLETLAGINWNPLANSTKIKGYGEHLNISPKDLQILPILQGGSSLFGDNQKHTLITTAEDTPKKVLQRGGTHYPNVSFSSSPNRLNNYGTILQLLNNLPLVGGNQKKLLALRDIIFKSLASMSQEYRTLPIKKGPKEFYSLQVDPTANDGGSDNIREFTLPIDTSCCAILAIPLVSRSQILLKLAFDYLQRTTNTSNAPESKLEFGHSKDVLISNAIRFQIGNIGVSTVDSDLFKEFHLTEDLYVSSQSNDYFYIYKVNPSNLKRPLRISVQKSSNKISYTAKYYGNYSVESSYSYTAWEFLPLDNYSSLSLKQRDEVKHTGKVLLLNYWRHMLDLRSFFDKLVDFFKEWGLDLVAFISLFTPFAGIGISYFTTKFIFKVVTEVLNELGIDPEHIKIVKWVYTGYRLVTTFSLKTPTTIKEVVSLGDNVVTAVDLGLEISISLEEKERKKWTSRFKVKKEALAVLSEKYFKPFKHNFKSMKFFINNHSNYKNAFKKSISVKHLYDITGEIKSKKKILN